MAIVIVVARAWVVRRAARATARRVRRRRAARARAAARRGGRPRDGACGGASLRDLVVGRDPVSGLVYALMLVVYALMPWLVHGTKPG